MLEYNIWGDDIEYGFLIKLRDGEGLDIEKIKNSYKILDKLIKVYDVSYQIDKEVIALVMNLPEQMRSFIEWNIQDKENIQIAIVKFNDYIRMLLRVDSCK